MRHRWTYEECYELAKTYKCSAEFKEKQPKAYKASLRHNWLKDYNWFIPHYRSIKWTYENCYKEALKYKTRKAFQDNCKSAYQRALLQGWLDDYNWMASQFKPKGYWEDYESVKNEANKYSSRAEFYKNSQFVYNIAREKGWLDTLFPYGDEIKHKLRYVYSYEFKEQKVVYVGLTCDIKRRHLQHKGIHSSGKFKSPVYVFSQKYGILVPEPIIWHEDSIVQEAQELENCVVMMYIEYGWTLLNKAKTGVGHSSIGSTITKKWTKEACYNEALKYHSKTEFSNRCQSAYSKSLRMGWIKDYNWFSTLGNKKWTYETCYNEALKYKTRWDFGKGNHTAYQVASKNKWLDDYHWFVKSTPVVKPRKWTYESCKKTASECSSRSEFVKKYKGAYEVCRKNGWLDEFIPFKKLNQYG